MHNLRCKIFKERKQQIEENKENKQKFMIILLYFPFVIEQIKMESQLCSAPKMIEFSYTEGQQLVATFPIKNLTDKVVEFKIKSNKPESYIVKPMEGSIYNRQSVKVTFKRKEMKRTEFESYLRNPGSIQEKFRLEFKSIQVNSPSSNQQLVQSVTVQSKFNLQTKQTESRLKKSFSEVVGDSKIQQIYSNLKEKVGAKENELGRLRVEEQELIENSKNRGGEEKCLNKKDIVTLLVLFFLIGLAL